MSPAGGVTALRMAEESADIIIEYTDAQAIEDGVLVEVSCGAVNRESMLSQILSGGV